MNLWCRSKLDLLFSPMRMCISLLRFFLSLSWAWNHAVSYLYPALNTIWSSDGSVSGVLLSSEGTSSIFLWAYPLVAICVSLCLSSSSSSSSYCGTGNSGLRLLDGALACGPPVKPRRGEETVRSSRLYCLLSAGTNSKNSQESFRVSLNRNTSSLKSRWLQTVGNHDLR